MFSLDRKENCESIAIPSFEYKQYEREGLNSKLLTREKFQFAPPRKGHFYRRRSSFPLPPPPPPLGSNEKKRSIKPAVPLREPLCF